MKIDGKRPSELRILRPERVPSPKWPERYGYHGAPLSPAERLAIANVRVMNAANAVASHPGDALYRVALDARRAERDAILRATERQR